MDKLNSRTLWVGLGLMVVSTHLLTQGSISDVVWGNTISMVFGAIAAKSVGEKFSQRG